MSEEYCFKCSGLSKFRERIGEDMMECFECGTNLINQRRVVILTKNNGYAVAKEICTAYGLVNGIRLSFTERGIICPRCNRDHRECDPALRDMEKVLVRALHKTFMYGASFNSKTWKHNYPRLVDFLYAADKKLKTTLESELENSPLPAAIFRIISGYACGHGL